MAQCVRRQVGVNAGCQRMAPHQQPERHARHCAPAGGDEKIVGRLPGEDLGPRFGQIARHPHPRVFAERHQPLFGSLAGHPEHAVGFRHLEDAQRHQLAHPQAAGIEQLQHGAVTQAEGRGGVGRVQQRLHLRLGQRAGHPQRLARGLQALCRVKLQPAFALRPTEIPAQDSEPAVGGGGAGYCVPGGEIGLQIGFARRVERQRAMLAEPFGEERKIPPISCQRVGRQAVFEPQRFDERRRCVVRWPGPSWGYVSKKDRPSPLLSCAR